MAIAHVSTGPKRPCADNTRKYDTPVHPSQAMGTCAYYFSPKDLAALKKDQLKCSVGGPARYQVLEDDILRNRLEEAEAAAAAAAHLKREEHYRGLDPRPARHRPKRQSAPQAHSSGTHWYPDARCRRQDEEYDDYPPVTSSHAQYDRYHAKGPVTPRNSRQLDRVPTMGEYSRTSYTNGAGGRSHATQEIVYTFMTPDGRVVTRRRVVRV